MESQSVLRAQGFEMKLTGKYWTIKMVGDKRATRLYRLGERYTGAAIDKRILEGGLRRRTAHYEKPRALSMRQEFTAVKTRRIRNGGLWTLRLQKS